MILTQGGKEIVAIYKQNGDEVDEVKDANGRLVYTNTREITGTLPLYFSSRGKPLSDYLISGNAVQDGTPSADAPVDATGCGEWDKAHQSYKLPLTVNGTEYPIYLGQCESTRRIRKLVLTGEEGWVRTLNQKCYYVDASTGCPTDYLKQTITTSICSHYQSQENTASGSNEVEVGHFCFYTGGGFELYIGETTISSAADFKSYLATQYQNGTPVTIWYVLAKPKTAIVNEPLMKIGNYADTISFAQSEVAIPTVSGANVLDMTATVKPSEVYIKGNGIKPTGYGQLVDNNSVRILDKNNVRILVHGQ